MTLTQFPGERGYPVDGVGGGFWGIVLGTVWVVLSFVGAGGVVMTETASTGSSLLVVGSAMLEVVVLTPLDGLVELDKGPV